MKSSNTTNSQSVDLDHDTVARAERFRVTRNTAVLAVAFTDIADSTAHREELGEREYERLREEHDNAVGVVVEAEEAGAVIKGLGDGALIVFSEPSTAVERMLRLQATMKSHPHFKLRIGIDMGQVALKARSGIVADVFGRHVNRASRIQGLAQPGHVLASFHVYDCAVGWLKGTGIEWANHGFKSLKGFDGSVSIHEAYLEADSFPQIFESASPTGVKEPLVLLSKPDSRVVDYDGRPMFSRSGGRDREAESGNSYRTRSNVSPLATLGRVFQRREPLHIRRLESAPHEDPYVHYGMEFKLLAEQWSGAQRSLWCFSMSPTSDDVKGLLMQSGIAVDVARSADEAIDVLRGVKHTLLVVCAKDDESLDGCRKLFGLRGRKYRDVPKLVFASAQIEAEHGAEILGLGAAACTSGLVSLLDAIRQTLVWQAYEH